MDVKKIERWIREHRIYFMFIYWLGLSYFAYTIGHAGAHVYDAYTQCHAADMDWQAAGVQAGVKKHTCCYDDIDGLQTCKQFNTTERNTARDAGEQVMSRNRLYVKDMPLGYQPFIMPNVNLTVMRP